MTDAELVRKKLGRIERWLLDLDQVAVADRLETDIVMERFVLHTLQLAIRATMDVASHIASDERLGEPRSNAELFALLARAGWIPEDDVSTLQAMVGFRNVLVHAYDDVNLSIVRDVLEHGLADLERFVATVRQRLDATLPSSCA